MTGQYHSRKSRASVRILIQFAFRPADGTAAMAAAVTNVF